MTRPTHTEVPLFVGGYSKLTARLLVHLDGVTERHVYAWSIDATESGELVACEAELPLHSDREEAELLIALRRVMALAREQLSPF